MLGDSKVGGNQILLNFIGSTSNDSIIENVIVVCVIYASLKLSIKLSERGFDSKIWICPLNCRIKNSGRAVGIGKNRGT